MRVFKKPKVRIRAGEHPLTTAFRFAHTGEFIRQQKHRLLLLAFLVIATLLSHLKVVYERTVPKFEDLKERRFSVLYADCRQQGKDGEYGGVAFWHDLHINSYAYDFVAMEVPKRLCQQMASMIKPGADVWITYYEGVIFQLRSETNVLLTQDLLKKGINSYFKRQAWFYEVLFYLLLIQVPLYFIHIALQKPRQLGQKRVAS